MEIILIHYGEIALKGAKRDFFEQTLIDNIAESLEISPDHIRQYKGQMVVEIEDGDVERALHRISRVMGVTWFAQAIICENDLEVIKEFAVDIAKDKLSEGSSFGIRGHRSIKSLPYNTPDINRQVGSAVAIATVSAIRQSSPTLNPGVSGNNIMEPRKKETIPPTVNMP